MVERYLMLRSACSGPRGEELRPLRRRKSGSETPELQSMSCEESQKLRSLEGQPRVAERGGEHRSQRLRVPVRHGLKFWIQWPGVASNGLRFVQWPRPCPIAVGSLSDRPIAVGRPSNGVRPTRSIWPIPPTISLNHHAPPPRGRRTRARTHFGGGLAGVGSSASRSLTARGPWRPSCVP